MSLESVRIGVPEIELGRPSTTACPAMNGVTLIASAVDEEESGNFLNNDVQSDLVVSRDYRFVVALVGYASSGNGGLSIGPASEVAGPVQVTAGQRIKLRVANGSLPSGFDECIAMAVFMRKGSSSSYQLAGFGYCNDGAADFETLVMAEPLTAAKAFSLATLQSGNSDPDLGDRNPLRNIYDLVPTTTGDVTINFNTTTAQVDPNNGPAYNIATTRGESLSFSVLSNVLKQIIKSAAGNYGKVTAESGETLEIGQRGLATASAVLSGTRPIRLQMPSDANGSGELTVYLGNLPNNQAAINLALNKSRPAPVNFTLDPAVQDSLLKNQHNVISYRRY